MKNNQRPSRNTKTLINQLALKKVYIRVGEKFFSRIDNHVRTLKYVNKQSPSKSEWLAKALHEKLENEKNLGIESVPRYKHINFDINSELNDDLENRVDFFRKFKHGFSKKQLIVEAIVEKLEREEQEARALINKMHFK